jgi:hypothetical protein
MHCALPPSEPLDGEHPRRFRLAAVGEAQPRGDWHPSAIARLQGFSSGSPAAFPHQWSRRMVTTGSMVGRSKPGCGLCPALSFKDLHHPYCGGGRAEPELYLPHRSVGHLFLQHSGERALIGLAEGRTLTTRGRSAASVVSSSMPGSLAQLALALLPVPPPTTGAGRGSPPTVWAAVAPCAPGDRPRRRTPLGQRSCSWIVLSLLRHDASVRRLVLARPRGLEWGSAGAGWGATRGHTSVSLALTACPRPSCGDVGEGLPTAAFALRSSLLLFSRLRRRSLSLLLQRSPASHPKFVVPQALRCGGCSYPREWNRSSVCNGTLSDGVCSLWLSGLEHLCIWA